MCYPKKIKICGITAREEAEYLNEAGVDYAGFVQFFPKSRRNLSTAQAVDIMKYLDPGIRTVAVTVSPSLEQLRTIEAAGFSAVQIHGAIADEVLERIHIPVIKAFNVSDLEAFSHYESMDQVAGFVLDAQTPGSGRTFDWSLLRELPPTDKMVLLAGGLTPDNAAEAVAALGERIDGVDTSSGVEHEEGAGKSREKILDFVRAVRSVRG